MNSPFQRHFGTNYCPTHEETHSIRALLVPHVDEVARLESLIRDLSAQRDQLKEHIGLHEALISPARRLPHDIIQEIFLACLPTRRNATMDLAQAPLLLGRICSAWRAIALSMPLLWARLHVNLDYVVSSGARIHFLGEWLERSAQCALTLSIAARKPPDSSSAVMDLLIKSSERWRNLNLVHLTEAYLGKLHGVAAPRLESIEATESGVENLDVNTLFQGTHIRRVALVRTHLWTLLPTMSWDHLTHLSLLTYFPSAQPTSSSSFVRAARY
ncbi:hypothetical protein B0H15DRAFT_778727 [Mycena belliarum]|uniref:F-box domain-containing protein n=1 Tax=Mycena belliarum TaxID=1033014 RepID=A0AAD6XNA1_9AGAR|nr:hypothetical protein B0H15DRAFT_778727 [Mycena belliae]